MPTTTVDLFNGSANNYNAQDGAQFDIIVSGTFTTFSLTLNNKTLTYTEVCNNQTITIDNVNMTVKNGIINKMANITGDFLNLNSFNNLIDIDITGTATFRFVYRPMYI